MRPVSNCNESLSLTKIKKHMNNGQFPSNSDLAALIDEVGGIKLESSEPLLSDTEQWVMLPGHNYGFVCALDAPVTAVNTLQNLLLILHETSALLESSQERVVSRVEMERLAMLDPLTELPNRRKLFECVQGILKNDQHSAILQIDLDRFKQINDSLGHAAGDEVLIVVANRLVANVRPGDLVARIGGDEFVVACPEVSNADSTAELAERLIESLNRPMQLQGHQYKIGASIGVAFKTPQQDIDPDTLLQNADLALYTSKAKGRNQYHLYNPFMRSKFDAVQSMKKELSEACDNGSIVAHFQPTFCMQSGLVSGIQAMARWQHSSLGLLTYGAFEQHADDNVLKNIDKVMLNQCLKGIRMLTEHKADVSKFSITASIQRMRDPEFVSYLQSETIRHGLSPSQVSLEIVEDCRATGESDALLNNVQEVRDAGYGISLSNFGGVNSSVQSLMKIEPHSVKLDGSMCRDLKANRVKQSLISGVINMAEHLNAAVVATVVETESDRDILGKLGCNFIQGNVMYPPSDIDTLASWLNSTNATIVKAA